MQFGEILIFNGLLRLIRLKLLFSSKKNSEGSKICEPIGIDFKCSISDKKLFRWQKTALSFPYEYILNHTSTLYELLAKTTAMNAKSMYTSHMYTSSLYRMTCIRKELFFIHITKAKRYYTYWQSYEINEPKLLFCRARIFEILLCPVCFGPGKSNSNPKSSY